jgi:ABC-2 type transport system ATP-binding protein
MEGYQAGATNQECREPDTMTTRTAPRRSSTPTDRSAEGEPVIQAKNLTKSWGSKTALDRVTFTIGPGVTGLLGANGAGKTTLLGMVLGLHRPTKGRLKVLGLNPSRAGTRVRGRVGYSPEHNSLPEDMRAHDLVRHIGEIHGLPRREATSRASDVLWAVGLGEERFRPIGTMSTGQKQRVKLAQAIVHDPALVLLDEPTDGLDPVQRDGMLALVRRVGHDFGINVVLSSHHLEEVERVCDSAVIIFGGTIVAAGPIDELTRGSEGLIVEVADRLDELVLALRVRGAHIEFHGVRLLVRATRDTGGADLHDVVRDALVASGAGVVRLSSHDLTLEEVFLGVGG